VRQAGTMQDKKSQKKCLLGIDGTRARTVFWMALQAAKRAESSTRTRQVAQAQA
jgi:hypothetical protein